MLIIRIYMNTNLLRIILFILMTLIYTHSLGENKLLSGSYYLGGDLNIDLQNNEPEFTHMFFYLKGDSAEDLYNLINSKPVYDFCLDDGSMTKFSGNIQCTVSKSQEKYNCYFSINPNDQKIDLGINC